MFVVEQLTASVEIREQQEINSMILYLANASYRPVLRSMLAAAAKAGDVPVNAIRVEALGGSLAYRRPTQWPIGDMLFSEYECGSRLNILQPMGPKLHCLEIRHHCVASGILAFAESIAEAARANLDGRRLRGMDFTWKVPKERSLRTAPQTNRFLNAASLKTQPPEYTEAELSCAQLLLDSDVRAFLLELAQLGKTRSVDSKLSPASTSILVDRGLIRREYLVLCRQDSKTLCKVSDRDELMNAYGDRFTCTTCGRLFRDEMTQDVFALTESGRGLLAGSRWMSIWITDLLVSSGISKDSIQWNATLGGDELDIMTDALGQRLFFELKDREFGLGDAYPFAIRVNRYGGRWGVVATTERVADEAKKFFDEEKSKSPIRIETLEGPEGIQRGMPSLVDRYSRSGILQLMNEITENLGISLVPIVSAWMQRVAEEVHKGKPSGEAKVVPHGPLEIVPVSH